MYQRLLFVLSFLFIAVVAMSQDVMTPTDGDYIYNPNATLGSNTNPIPAGAGIVQKWVHDPSQNPGRIPWDQTKFKSYRLNEMSYRLRFPENYNPANKYPIVIFLHGAGEVCDANNSRNVNSANRENQDQLFWGAQGFSNYINSGAWNGFLLFPQLYSTNKNWTPEVNLPLVNAILDKLVQYNGVDPDRVTTMGLSAGGLGALAYADSFPTRIASAISSCPEGVQGLVPKLSRFAEVPVWMASGGADVNPSDPSNAVYFRDEFGKAGGDIYWSYYPTLPHQVWDTQWNRTDNNNNLILLQYWNAAHKAQPVVYFQNTQFCNTATISAKMGISAGFNAYEWQMDNGSGFTTIPGATSNTYTATQVGNYRVHFKRTATSAWSDWTPKPIVISRKACATDTAYVEHFDPYPTTYFTAIPITGVYPSIYSANNTGCQNGIVANATEGFSQDALGNNRSKGRFLVENTNPSCTYTTNDQVWRSNTNNNFTVQPNTDYTFSFYMANQANVLTYGAPGTMATFQPTAKLVPLVNGTAIPAASAGVSALLQGDVSWKKYSFKWNSGGLSSTYLSINNLTATGSGVQGNDFVIDEISLTKYKAPPMPGAAFLNATLWAKANSVTNVDGGHVGAWQNDNINGNYLQQIAGANQPLYKNNSSDNINFNPVISYNSAGKIYNYVPGGFSGTAVHSAAHVYVVSKFNNVNTEQTMLYENESGSAVRIESHSTGSVSFTAGAGASAISTPANTTSGNEVNKPILWTFSKDNSSNNTPDGNKQDIRKNGIVVSATGTSTGTFTGSNNDFQLGIVDPSNSTSLFDGNIAEIVYLLDSTVTSARQNKIESYLALKYGITLGNTTTARNYTASDNTVFWTGNTTYQNDVFGIGKDSLSGLLQLQSNSANTGGGNGTGQSAKGNLVLSTNATTTLDDRDFLMIGSDAATLTQSVILAGQAPALAVGATRVGREWKVVNTGNVGKVDLSFDTTGLSNQAGGSVVSNYMLMIDNDGDGNFATGTVSYFTATSASGNKIIFTGATLNNGVVFTIITQISSALPAIWLGFTAEPVNGDALLNWKTGDEINVDHYVVEHSYNGVSFSVIASVTANNSTGVNNYSYTDKGLAAGVHYYRIRRVDKDGKSEYSETRSVKINTTGANVQIMPNPVAGSTLTLAIAVPQASKTMAQIMSVDGKVLMQKQLNLAMGNNVVTLDISYVPSGVYLLQVQLNDGAVTRKFIRQH